MGINRTTITLKALVAITALLFVFTGPTLAQRDGTDATVPAGTVTREDPVQTTIDPVWSADPLHADAWKALERGLAMLENGEPMPAAPPLTRMPGFNCFPTCAANDGRFLAIASADFATLSDPVIELSIGVPAGSPDFIVGIFDGDGAGLDGLGQFHWDNGDIDVLYELSIFADPLRDGSVLTPVEIFPSVFTVPSTSLLDNGWSDFTITSHPAAVAPNGNSFYLLRFALVDLGASTGNAFKVRSNGIGTIEPVAQPFSYVANWSSLEDLNIIYPTFPSPTPTNYGPSGPFSFFFEVPITISALEVWDGDFDHGNFDGTDLDSDDFNSVGIPIFANASANPESASSGLGASSGDPPDDLNPAGFGVFVTRSPAIVYDVILPDSTVISNPNPSGNTEWERFVVAVPGGDPSPDVTVASLPSGLYELRISGLDMLNINALRLPFRAVCVDEMGVPCVPLYPYHIGDTVFLDSNGDGVQDVGEVGIENVLLEIFDFDGMMIATATTDSSGNYLFPVDPGMYEVQVASSNFDPGGALEDLSSTTGDQITNTVVDDNVLTYDFGYTGTGTIGDYVWYDLNSDGLQDEPITAGLAGVTVNLIEAGDDTLFGTADDQTFPPQITGANGDYLFENLLPGSYRVDVDESTLPADLLLTTGNEPLDIVLASGGVDLTADFGYVVDSALAGSLGDTVFYDVNGNGVEEAGDPGLDAIPIFLFGDPDGDGVAEIELTAFTDTVGFYEFIELPEGFYTVLVDSSALTPLGIDLQTFDLDGIGTPDETFLVLGQGNPINNPDVDFGYTGKGLIGDFVWRDDNQDGVQDVGELGLPGLLVTLRDSGGNVIATTTTDGGGSYLFTNLPAGFFEVEVAQPAGLDPTFDFDGIVTPNVAIVELGLCGGGGGPIGIIVSEGEGGGDLRLGTGGGTPPCECLEVDFGYDAFASIGDFVWNDVNADGVQDLGEPGLGGLTVTLQDSGGNPIASTTTDPAGFYLFDLLPAGTYMVVVTPPVGFDPTFDLDGIATPNIATATLADGEDRTDVDFGLAELGSIGDFVWNDTNADGVQDAGELGIGGLTVTLRDTGGNVLDTTTTDGVGGYLFDRLPAATYTVDVTPGAGFDPTFDLDGIATANTATAALAINEDRTDVDFGLVQFGSIGDFVWRDSNADGVQDVGEAGIPGVAVTLRDSGGNIVDTATTGAAGDYLFEDLVAGDYSVEVGQPAGLDPTFDLDGIATPNTADLTLDPDEDQLDVDFGYINYGSIGDFVWNDLNADGVQDAGELGIGGVAVTLRDGGGNVVGTTTTDGAGGYLFEDLPPGTYTVEVSAPAGFEQTFDLDGLGTPDAASLTLAEGDDRLDVDFGYVQLGSIGDFVWNDLNADGVQDVGELGIGGLTVTLRDSGGNVVTTTTTDGAGGYSFTDLPADGYTVEVAPPAGFSPTFDLDGIATASIASVPLAAGQDRTDADFGYVQFASLGDFVWNDLNADGVQDAGELGIGGLTVTLRDGGGNVVATTTTDGAGLYAFSGLAAGAYTVDVAPPAGFDPTFDLDGIATANTASLALSAGENRIDVDFGYVQLGSIGDFVWNDTNADGVQDAGEPGIGGLTVTLRDGGGNVVSTTTTDSNGGYTFGGLVAGDYTVDVGAPAGFDPTFDLDGIATANTASLTLGAGDDRTDVDFGYVQLGSIGDFVWNDTNGDGVQDAGEPGIGGLTVTLRDGGGNVIATTTTDGNGGYTFGGLVAGDYTVEVAPPAGLSPTFDLDGVGTPNTASLTLGPGNDRSDVDFGYTAPLGSLGDRVWEDLNGDGVQDAGEPGINGVTVNLLDTGGNVIATMVTAGDGAYTFGGLAAGTYTAQVDASSLPAALVQTFDLDGLASANEATLTLGTGDNRTDVDFGYQMTDIDEICVDGASPDALGGSSNGHAFWLPGISKHLVFRPDPGVVQMTGTTATMSGRLESLIDPSIIFDAQVSFSGLQVTPPAGSPKLELPSSAYVANGGPIDPSTWFYYTAYTGILTGSGSMNGAVIEITGAGPAFQIGVGANGKNGNFGGSGWFDWTVTSQPTMGDSLPVTGRGDINIDEVDCPEECIEIDFETDDEGFALSSGQVIDDEFAAFGIQVTTQDPVNHPAMIFNSASPTGGDSDLGTPNQAFGGPGVGAGGASGAGVNLEALGNLLIISEDADSGDPDDNASGGFLQFTFDTAVMIDSVKLVDIDEGTICTLKAFDAANNLIGTTTAQNLGNNSVQTLTLGTNGVRRLKVELTGSGALAKLVVCPGEGGGGGPICQPGDVREDFENGFSGNTGSNSWSGDWIENDPEAGGAGPGSGQVRVAGGFLKLDDSPDTGGEPSLAREVDLTGALSAVFRFDFDTSYGVDLDDAVTVEVSSDGGANWTILEVITGIDGEIWDEREFDISAFISPNTQVRFRVSNKYGGSDETFFVGYAEIVWGCEPVQLGSIGDFVWNDLNGDGVQDGGEPGIDGLNVTLRDAGGNVVNTTTTDGSGAYSFGGLSAGVYSVDVSAPASFDPTFDIDGIATANTATVSLSAGEDRDDVDFGYVEVVTCAPGNVKDTFNSVSFANNDGADNWSGPWIEDDVSSPGPAAGRVRIADGFMFLDDSPNTGTEPSAAREVDLSGAASARLKFAFDTGPGVDPGDEVTVEVSSDGGQTWTTVDVLSGFSGAVTGSRDIDISPYISANTQVRFRVSNSYGGSNEYFCLRWVKVIWSCDPPTIGGGDPCPGCTHYNGYLGQTGDYDRQPDGNSYWSEAGTHEGWLTGDAGTDFDLYLYKWNGSNWRNVASSYNDQTSDEDINYQGGAGDYLWIVHSYDGSGGYEFRLNRP